MSGALHAAKMARIGRRERERAKKTREVIIAEIVSQPQQHAEKWETQLEHDGFESWIYLNKVFPPGKVKITIEVQSSTSSARNDEE